MSAVPHMKRPLFAAGFVGALAIFLVGGLAAQQQPAQQGEEQPEQAQPIRIDPGELVFEREVFSYPTFQRRNPFRPLVGSEAGPRFEGMSVQGIVFTSEDPSQSMVLMRAGGGGETAAQTRRLRTGQTWGNVTVLEVRRREVLVEVQEFGITEQRVMRLPTPGQGGS